MSGPDPVAVPPRTIKLTVEYDGTDFAGWQRQAGEISVQQVLEEALAVPLGVPVTVVASGRTDAGVHAAGQVASLRTSSDTPLAGVIHGTNSALPRGIAVLDAEEVAPEFHARKSARGKHYRYRILNRGIRSPLGERYASWIRDELDVGRMAEAAGVLIGTHDYSAFRNAGSFEGSAVRTLSRIDIVREGNFIAIDVVGDGFLYKMVRNLVGTLVLAGRGKLATSEVESILSGGDRRCAGPTAPPQGLCLVEVYY